MAIPVGPNIEEIAVAHGGDTTDEMVVALDDLRSKLASVPIHGRTLSITTEVRDGRYSLVARAVRR